MASEYLKASLAVENVEIVAIYSRNQKTASLLASKFNISVIADAVDSFVGLNLDFLIVCVPELATKSIISTFSLLNVPLLVEKPVGLTLFDALDIELSAKEKQLSIYAALNRRFYGSTLKVFDELLNTSEKRIVRVTDQENTLAAIAAGQPGLVVENWMFANSIHIIDFITMACRGEPNLVFKQIIKLDSSAFVVHASIQFSSGDEALYTCYWNSPAGWSVDVNTSITTWQLSPLEFARSRRLEDRKFTDFGSDEIDENFKPGLVRMLIELDKCSRGQDHALPSIAEANRTMKLIELIYAND